MDARWISRSSNFYKFMHHFWPFLNSVGVTYKNDLFASRNTEEH